MARGGDEVTDAELAVLQALWDRGESSIRMLTDAIYPGGGVSAYSTVQKLLERLEGKKQVRRRKCDGMHLFVAVVGRDELIGRRLRTMAEKLCGGSLAPVLTQLVKAERL